MGSSNGRKWIAGRTGQAFIALEVDDKTDPSEMPDAFRVYMHIGLSVQKEAPEPKANFEALELIGILGHWYEKSAIYSGFCNLDAEIQSWLDGVVVEAKEHVRKAASGIIVPQPALPQAGPDFRGKALLKP